jgi:hypothetical protein
MGMAMMAGMADVKPHVMQQSGILQQLARRGVKLVNRPGCVE